MARFSAGVKTGTGSTTLPFASLYAGATGGCALREIGIANTTSSAFDIVLRRLTTTGTQGAGLTEAKHDPNSGPALCTAFTTHTVLPTLGDDLGYRWSIADAVGAGIVWTFGGSGLVIPLGVTNGIGVLVENGTGQICQVDLVWDE